MTVPIMLQTSAKNGGVSLLGIGGASAINTKHVKSVEILAYGELGTESIKKSILIAIA